MTRKTKRYLREQREAAAPQVTAAWDERQAPTRKAGTNDAPSDMTLHSAPTRKEAAWDMRARHRAQERYVNRPAFAGGQMEQAMAAMALRGIE